MSICACHTFFFCNCISEQVKDDAIAAAAVDDTVLMMVWVALRGSKTGDAEKAAAEEGEEEPAGDAADEAKGEDEEIAVGEESATGEETTTGEEITEQAAAEQQQQQEEQEDCNCIFKQKGLKSEFIISGLGHCLIHWVR